MGQGATTAQAGMHAGIAAPPPVETLAGWLHWRDAVALAGVLAAAGQTAGRPLAPGALAAEQREFDRVQRLLGRAVDAFDLLPEPALTPWRRALHDLQARMEAAAAPLRARLRRAVAAASPALADIDAALETALAGRERTLLHGLATRLEAHWRALQGDGRFADDQCRLLHAEWQLRLQPARGLLAALAEHAPGTTPT